MRIIVLQLRYKFQQIEKLIEDKLPQAARKELSWWSNNESQPWNEKGWYTLYVNLVEETVTFVRKPYAIEYTKFFDSLLLKLSKKETQFRVNFPYQDGRHYTTVTTFPTSNEPIGNLTYSFNDQYQTFRIELFINKNNEDKNKKIFDQFQKKKQVIEEHMKLLDGVMKWERMDNNKPSRISLCYTKTIWIKDDQEKLENLQEWAINAIIEFNRILTEQYNIIQNS